MWAPGYDRKANYGTSQKVTNGLNNNVTFGALEGRYHTGLPGMGDKHLSQDIVTSSLMIRPVLNRYAVPNIKYTDNLLHLGG